MENKLVIVPLFFSLCTWLNERVRERMKNNKIPLFRLLKWSKELCIINVDKKTFFYIDLLKVDTPADGISIFFHHHIFTERRE